MSFRMLDRQITGSRDPAANVTDYYSVFTNKTGGKTYEHTGAKLDSDPVVDDTVLSKNYDELNKTIAIQLKEQREERLQTKKALSYAQASEGVNDFLSAIREYKQFSENADRNVRLIQEDIDQLSRDAERTRQLGKADAFQEQLKGRQRGDDAKLKLAAQGQKVSGRGVKRVSRAHQIASATRAAQRENAALERALGLEQEGVNLKIRQADLQRQKAYARLQSNVKGFGGLISTGIGAYSGLTTEV